MVTGTVGDDMTINGKTTSLINSNDPNGNGVAHTFSIPTLGINVPALRRQRQRLELLQRRGPCPLSAAHNIVKFSFMTPGPGQYPWQCFVPCGLGYLYGNGGPMQTVGLHGRVLEGGRLMPSDDRTAKAGPPIRRRTEPRHGWRMIAVWAVLSAIADPIFYLPGRPPHPARDDDQRRRTGRSSTSTSCSSSPCRC